MATQKIIHAKSKQRSFLVVWTKSPFWKGDKVIQNVVRISQTRVTSCIMWHLRNDFIKLHHAVRILRITCQQDEVMILIHLSACMTFRQWHLYSV
jgi:hypothetical protein